MSLIMRKPVFGVSDHLRLKLVYSASGTSQITETLHVTSYPESE